ncbi:MAG: DUF72 domain-containing protein [Planctomycetota bacterium]
MQMFVGTSGYSYKEWKGTFYPDGTKPAEMLSYYLTQLPAVEINNTFYRMPTEKVLSGWAEQTPDDFRFSIKASRRITHMKRLKGVEEDVSFLLSSLETLGARLGALLFQLPPNFKKDIERIEAFFQLLPPGTPTVFEFRHDSWFDEETAQVLQAHSCAWCVSDVDDEDSPELRMTAPSGYVRLRRESYTSKALQTWHERIAAMPWEKAFVFFKHEDEARGPTYAAEFRSMGDS